MRFGTRFQRLTRFRGAVSWSAALVGAALGGACTTDTSGIGSGSGGNAGASVGGGAGGGAGSAGQAGSAGYAGDVSDASVSAGAGGEDAAVSTAGTDGGLSGIDLDELRAGVPYPSSPYPEENPPTAEKALLGKILFWEEQLSADNTVACGTCHRPSAGGSDPRSALTASLLPGPDQDVGTEDDIRGSLGIIACDASGTQVGSAVQVTLRKSPSYLDAMFGTAIFWDGRTQCVGEDCPRTSAFEDPDNPGTFPIRRDGALESQAVGPPLNEVEMACAGATWPGIHAKLAAATPLALARNIPADLTAFIAEHGASYPALFAAAFGTEQTSGPPEEINTRRIAFAIATHERNLRSNQTPWDAFHAGDDDALTPAQLRGLAFFHGEANCRTCHQPPIFNDGQFHYTGFYKPEWDEGRGVITGRTEDRARMRTPTLRNVGLRVGGGLLHSGAGPGESLEAVMRHYARGGLHDDPDVAAVPIDQGVTGFDMSEAQLRDVIDFMVNGLTDPRVAREEPPFDRPTLSTE